MSIDFNPAHAFAYALAAIGDLTARRTMNTITNYTDLANRFREGLSLSTSELEQLRDHAQTNRNYLLERQVVDAISESMSALIDTPIVSDSPSAKEREFHRNQPPYDSGEEL